MFQPELNLKTMPANAHKLYNYLPKKIKITHCDYEEYFIDDDDVENLKCEFKNNCDLSLYLSFTEYKYYYFIYYGCKKCTDDDMDGTFSMVGVNENAEIAIKELIRGISEDKDFYISKIDFNDLKNIVK